MALKDVGVKLVVEGANEFKNKLNTASDQVNNLGDKMKNVAPAMKKAGLVMTGAAAGIGVASLKMAADFEGAMREVNTMMQLGEDEFKSLSDQVLQTAQDVGKSPEEMAQALYQVVSAGIPAGEALQFLETSAKAAIGGVTDTTTAVDGITTVINAFGMEASDAQKVADIMFTTVKGGKTTFEELSSSMFNVAPLASSAGVSFSEVSAALATMTKQGVPTKVATTQLRTAIQSIIKPTTEMTIALRSVGEEMINNGELTGEIVDSYKILMDGIKRQGEALEAGEITQSEYDKNVQLLNEDIDSLFASIGTGVIESKGLQGALEALTTTADGNTDTMGKMFGSVEGLQAVLALTGDNAETFAADLDAVTKATEGAGAATDAYNQMNEGAARQFEQLMTQIKGTAIQIGTALMPAILSLVEILRPLLEKLAKWISDNPILTAVIVGVVGILGALLLTLGLLIPALTAIPAIMGAIGAAMTIALGPIGLIIAAVAGLAAGAILLWKNWDKVSAGLKAIWEGLKTAAVAIFKGIATAVLSPYKAILETIKLIVDKVADLPIVSGIAKPIQGAIDAALAGISGLTYFQHGGISQGGMSIVGENGPEMVSLPRGTSIQPVNNTYNITENYARPEQPQSLDQSLMALAMYART